MLKTHSCARALLPIAQSSVKDADITLVHISSQFCCGMYILGKKKALSFDRAFLKYA
jgi:hypothetical protein